MSFVPVRVTFFSLGSITFARPLSDASTVATVTNIAQVSSILTTLEALMDKILSQLDAFSPIGTTSDTEVMPLLTELVTFLDAASTALDALLPVSALPGLKLKRQSTGDVLLLVTIIQTKVNSVIDILPTSSLPEANPVIATIQNKLAQMINIVELVLPDWTTPTNLNATFLGFIHLLELILS